MGCVKSKLNQDKPKKVCTCQYYGDTWLNKPDEGYHWEQNQERTVKYECYSKDGAGCEGAILTGMVAVGGAGLGMTGVVDSMGAAACGSGSAAGGGGTAGCGAGGCGGCGGCGA